MRVSALLLTSLLAAGRAAALPPELNQITKIDVQETDGAIVITIAGSKPPSFTTFPLEDPPRFVVDFNDATLVKVPDDIAVGNGTINLIRTVNYPGEATSIARVMIAFARPVDPPELQAVGNAVVLKVARPAPGRGDVAAAPTAAPAAPAANSQVAPVAAAAVAAVATAAPDDAAATARAAAEKARADAAAEAKAQADAKARAEAEAAAAAEAKAAAEAAANAQAQAAAKAKAEAAATAQASAGEQRRVEARPARPVETAQAEIPPARAGADAANPEADPDARALADERARQDRENEEAKAWKAARRAEANAAPTQAKVKVTRLNDAAAAEEEAKRAAERAAKKNAEAEARLKVARAREGRLKELGLPPSGASAAVSPGTEPHAVADDADAKNVAARAAEAAAADAAAAESKAAEARAKSEADATARAEAQAQAQREATERADAAKDAKLAAARDAAEKVRIERERKDAARRDAAERVKAAKAEKLAAHRDAVERAKAAKAEKLAAQRDAVERAKAAKAEELAAQRAAAKVATPVAKIAKPAQRPAAVAAAQHEVREVGFKQLAGASRVFVRMSSPSRFTISEAGEKILRLEIENTRIARRNDARALDTSFFSSAVARITPRRSGTSTIVEIALREHVAYQQRVDGDMLAIDFERPAGARVRPPGAVPAALDGAPVPADAPAGDAPDGEARQ